MKRIIIGAVLLLTTAVTAFSQTRSITVSGRVMEDDTKQPAMQATVQLLSLPDSAQAAGVASSNQGYFKLPKVKPGKYTLRISYIGYKSKFIPMILTAAVPEKNIGTVTLESDAVMLSEAVVVAEAPQVQVVEDTVAFNSSAYRTPEGAMLEELVKKLCQVSFKYKFPYKLIMKYFSNDSKEYYGYNNRKTFLSYIRDYTVNPNYTLERIVNNELSDNYMSLFQDMLQECRYFNFKINVKWSEKRLILEHAKLSKMVSDKMFSLKENEYIKYDGKLNYPDNFTVELLDESKKFFYEGNEMHNCVYTSYLKFGLNKTMFFFSVKLPERCTFNVRKDGDRFEIEQIRSIRNGNVSSSMHNMVCEWVNREDVQEWFKLNYKGLYEEKKDIDDMDDTVDFTFDNIRRAV